MNRPVILFLSILSVTFQLSAQISEGGLPCSLSMKQLKGTTAVPSFTLRSLDKSALMKEDSLHPTPFRYAVFEDVNIDLKKTGRKDTLTDPHGIIWRLKLQCDSAYSIQVIMGKFNIPPGAKLFIYSEGYSQILGAYTSANMHRDSTLVIEDIVGNKAVVEYYEPFGSKFNGRIIIGSVSKGYKNIYRLKSGTDFININCSDGKELQLPKHAVCKISFRSGSSSYLCTGSLINDAKNDKKPYFLTASHCINDSAEAASLVAYFNYENDGCNGNALIYKTLTGASLMTTSPASDYSLLLLNDNPGPGYQPFYAGWDASGKVIGRVAGIHHPEGLTKKLSIDNDSIISNANTIQWEGNVVSPVSSHWQVNFDEGLTAGGSSGSPLFNKKNQIIGQLHGGDSTYDLYGKFSYSWNHTSGKFPQLSQFLDPDHSGILSMEGFSPATNPPDAFIDVPVSKVCLNAPVKLTDYSVFAPYTRNWTISPSTFVYTDGTSPTSPDPVIKFLQPGSYSVKLNVRKTAGRDSMKIDNAFQAGNTIDVGILSSPGNESCLCCFNYFRAWAIGAANYRWAVLPGSADKIQLDHEFADTVKISPVPGFQADSSVSVKLQVTGSHGTCSDTAVLTYNLIKPVNDNIQNAILLQYGKSPTYSNKCATVESGEPVPPHTSCTTQYSWCDEYGTGVNIVEKSLWFKFVAGGTDYVSISSLGFDDEIALYSADSYADILNNNYTLLSANDDRSTTDYNPIIRSAKITQGKTYWVQVDGSGGGQEGNFDLQLIAITPSAVIPEKTDRLLVYPQPASDFVYIRGNVLANLPVKLSAYTIAGDLIYSDRVRFDAGSIILNINTWEKGIYVVKIESGMDIYVTRIIKD